MAARSDEPRALSSNQRLLGGAYVAVFVLIMLYAEIPWAGVLAQWAGR